MENSRYPNRLKKYRRIAGYSQKKVARLFGFSDTSTISRWEKGVTSPGIIELFTLARLYNAFPHDLYLELWNKIISEKNLLTQPESIIT